MDHLLNLVDQQALKSRQDAIIRALKRDGSQEIGRQLALLSLLAERLLYENEVNRSSLELINVPIMRGLLNGKLVTSRLHVTAEAPFDAVSGFHALEHDLKGSPFRWTGPSSQFKFELMIDRTRVCNAVLRMLNSGHLTLQYLNSMRVYVDGKNVPATPKITELVELQFAIPPRASSVSQSSIIIECPMWSPASAQNSEDTRMLGVPFFDLSIEPVS